VRGTFARDGVVQLIGARQRPLDFLQFKQILIREFLGGLCGRAVPNVGDVDLFYNLFAKDDSLEMLLGALAAETGQG
jgi:hypothetical protein